MSRSVVGKLMEMFCPNIIHFIVDESGLCARVSRVGGAYCLLSFVDKVEQDWFLEHNCDLLEPWLKDLLAWKDSDLSVTNQR